jgi:hypothetical protein
MVIDLPGIVGIGVACGSVGIIEEDGARMTELLDLSATRTSIVVALTARAAVGHDRTKIRIWIAPTVVVAIGTARCSRTFDSTTVVMGPLVVTLSIDWEEWTVLRVG